MLRVRVVPCLLVRGSGLYKTTRFTDPRYVGDPINVVRIFNDKEVDELIVLDIDASKEKRPPNFALLEDIASECFMPLCYGGGIRNIEDARRILSLGVEKVAINTAACEIPGLVETMAQEFGSQSIVVSIDVKQGIFGGYECMIRGGRQRTGRKPQDLAREMQECGAGEILINAIDRDGTMSGYDLGLIRTISSTISIPLIACGGAGSIEHLRQAHEVGADALACGAFFVFKGPHRAVLVNVPPRHELEAALDT